MSYKDDDYKNKINRVRAEAHNEIKKLADRFNDGKISEAEFKKGEFEILTGANSKRTQILDDRKREIDNQVLSYHQKLAGGGAKVSELRKHYEGLEKSNKDELIKHYETSLKLGDETAARAAAIKAVEKGIPEVLKDYGNRDRGFAETLNEYVQFNNRYNSQEARISANLTDYRKIEAPYKKREKFEAGKFRGPDGYPRPYYRERIKID